MLVRNVIHSWKQICIHLMDKGIISMKQLAHTMAAQVGAAAVEAVVVLQHVVAIYVQKALNVVLTRELKHAVIHMDNVLKKEIYAVQTIVI